MICRRQSLLALASIRPRRSTSLSLKNSYDYNSLLGRPIDSMAINSLVSLDIECLKLLHFDMLLPWSASIFLAAAGLRCGFEITKAIMNSMTESQLSSMKQYYSINALLSTSINGYLFLTFNRALNHITTHSHQFAGLQTESLLWLETILGHDPYFVLPVITMGINYVLLKYSTHPFLLNLRADPNPLKIINLSFFSGFLAVFMPANYLLGYFGFVLMHMGLRRFQSYSENKQANAAFKKYALPKDFFKKY